MAEPAMDLETFDWPQSIRGINNLDVPVKEELYFSLLPDEAIERFSLSAHDSRLTINSPADTRSVEMIFHERKDISDPTFYLHMADTLNNQIAVLLLVINDINAERYNVDVDPFGRSTRFGTLSRNITEELRALEAGLAPGQLRKGMRMFRHALPTFETFIRRTGHDLIIMDPLTYHNAIMYERYGFKYIQGRKRMEWINDVLRPGGEYYNRFDTANPFRQPEFWKSIRGRSWAIHDGILGEPFGDIRMYKQLGNHAGLNTFPDGIW